MRPRHFYVYILASKVGGTLYIGVTNDLIRRVAEHRMKLVESFTEKYDVARLVYFEQFDDPENAIRREKRLKKWNRAWKIRLIEEGESKNKQPLFLINNTRHCFCRLPRRRPRG